LHELSIVQRIIELSRDEVVKAGAKKVDRIDLEIGELAGIEMDAFLFAWDVAVEGTVLSSAARTIERTPGKGVCSLCDTAYRMRELYDPCPGCGGHFAEMVSGREMKLRSLIVS
jgi:hydrogenase nickel incorporation protein HypA/HybF